MKNIRGRIIISSLLALFVINCFNIPARAENAVSKPDRNPQILLARMTSKNDSSIKNITHAPLTLDRKGCSYEPASSNMPLNVQTDVRISEDDISFSNAVVGGNLYIYSNNVSLKNLDIKGSILISPDSDGLLRLNNVTHTGIEMMREGKTGTERSRPDSEKTGRGGPGETVVSDIDPFLIDTETGPENNPVPSEKYEIDPAENSESIPESASNLKNNPDPAAKSKSQEISNPLKIFLELISIDADDNKLLVVNKSRSLPSNYKPGDLALLRVPYRGRPEARYMRKEAADALERLFAKAKNDKVELCAISGFRSFELQKLVHAKYVSQLGAKRAGTVSALPGYSEHQTGLAVDISSRSVSYRLEQAFGNTKEGKWLAQNAAGFGFIIRYLKGKEAITGYAYEPWHIRYVGKDLAEDIAKKKVTLEEYFELLE